MQHSYFNSMSILHFSAFIVSCLGKCSLNHFNCAVYYSCITFVNACRNGVNLLRIHSTCTKLPNMLFTRQEQHPCLLLKSSKSQKPELDHVRVEELLQSRCLVTDVYTQTVLGLTCTADLIYCIKSTSTVCLDRRYGKDEWT